MKLVPSKKDKSSWKRILWLLCACAALFLSVRRWNDMITHEHSTTSLADAGLPSSTAAASTPPSYDTSAREWIWQEMDQQQQKIAMGKVLSHLDNFLDILKQTKIDRWVSQEKCEIALFGSQWGTHQLCNLTRPPPDCTFLSFGISSDYSFDTDLATRYNCRGFLADPTVVHKSQLHDRLTFHNLAAKTLRPNQEARDAKRPWWTVSVPAVKKFLGLNHIDVLKMDCEGCEFSLAHDILLEEPDFFQHVDQFTFEVHLNQHWLNDTESFYYMAMLYKLLDEAGLNVMGTSIGGCGWDVEKYKSMPEMIELGYPNAGKEPVRSRRSCHEYLFARELA